jgi:uncharacterized protein (DUF934 family)
MRFVKDGIVAEDKFQRVADDASPPPGPVLFSAARFMADPSAALAHAGSVGVIWPNNRAIAELAPHLDRLAAVVLVFPTFRDGRAYSQARLLRERYGYHGELRATGQVLRDQFLFMLRAGFDTFEVVKDKDADAFGEAIHRYSRFYQASVDQRPVISRLRRAHDPAIASAARRGAS